MNASGKSFNGVSKVNGLARTAVLALGLCGALVGGTLGVSGHAEARVNTSRGSAAEIRCGTIQDAYDYWYGVWRDPSSSPEAKAQAAQKMNSYVDSWESECRGQFGSIVYIKAGTTIAPGLAGNTLTAQPATGRVSVSPVSSTQAR